MTYALRTKRLLLRAFKESDAPRLAQLAGKREIADTMISVPHPYSVEQARSSIAGFAEEYHSGSGFHFAIALLDQPRDFIGYIALKSVDLEHEEAELSFWIDIGYSRRGYATEAGRAILTRAFTHLELNRVCAYHMTRNSASASVLAGLGFSTEGRLRQRVKKWGKYEDVLVAAKLKRDSPALTGGLDECSRAVK